MKVREGGMKVMGRGKWVRDIEGKEGEGVKNGYIKRKKIYNKRTNLNQWTDEKNYKNYQERKNFPTKCLVKILVIFSRHGMSTQLFLNLALKYNLT